jgi:hypothetical protein
LLAARCASPYCSIGVGRGIGKDLQRAFGGSTYAEYTEKVTGVNKRAGEDPERVNAEVDYRIEMVAYPEKLDLDKPADRGGGTGDTFPRGSRFV